MTVTPEEITAWRALCADATPGPWHEGLRWVYTSPIYEDDVRLSNIFGMDYSDPDRQDLLMGDGAS